MPQPLQDDKQTATSLRTLERGLDILDCFIQHQTSFSLTELASRTNLNPSTAFRILATLEKRQYVIRNPETKKYSLGIKAQPLFSPPPATLDLRIAASPHLKQLHAELNENVSLYVVIDQFRVCLDRLETTRPLRQIMRIGDRLPLTFGASGKALVAWMTQKDRQRHGVVDYPISDQELANIRRVGYAVSRDERGEGLSAVSAPIFDASGRVVAALSMSGPVIRFTEEFIETAIPLVVTAATAISATLGFHGNPAPLT